METKPLVSEKPIAPHEADTASYHTMQKLVGVQSVRESRIYYLERPQSVYCLR